MNNSIDSMLDMYLFETNTLLEQLEELFIGAEMEKTLSSSNIDEIFRIMHTIKGSSAMMEFTSLMEIAHRIEDLFFYIRENGMENMSEAYVSDLFDILFQSMDYFKSEVDKIQKGEPLSDNIDNFVTNINMFLDKIKNPAQEIQSDSAQPDTQTAEENSGAQESELRRMCTLSVFFEEDSGMEHIRAFMLVTALREAGLNFEYFPEDIETNREAASYILDRGFSIFFESQELANKAVTFIKNTNGIRSYEIICEDEKEKEDKAAAQSAAKNEKAHLQEKLHKETKADPQAELETVNAKINSAPNKQSLISVNLSKLVS